MSGGGGSQVTNSTPWASATPYLTDIMGQAQNLYKSSNPQYANPAGNFGFGQATGAVGNALTGTTTLGGMASQLAPVASSNISSQFANPFGTTGNLDATSAIKQELSGTPDYTAVNGALDAANTQQWNQFYNQVVPQLNQRASFLGNPSGAIKDLNSAVTQIGQNQNLNAQQAYLGQYNNAQQRQQTAAGLVASGGLQGQSNATSLGGLAGGLASGVGSQALSGAQLYPTISSQPQQNLADYGSIISNAGGKFGSQSTSMNPGASGTAANVIGGLTAGSGLLNQLFGSPATAGGSAVSGLSGLTGLLGKLFGGSGSNYNQLGQFLSAGNNPGSTAISGQYANPLDQFGNNYYGMVNDPSMTDFGSLSGADPNSSLFDPGSINWGPSGAGGQAATQSGDAMGASNFQSTDTTPSFDAYQATAPDGISPASSSSMPTLGQAFGAGSDVLGIAGGINSGTPTGYASAALDTAKLAKQAGVIDSSASPMLGAAGSAFGLYGGLKQGGLGGDTQAAASAAQLGSLAANAAGAGGTAAGTALGTLGAVGGAVAIPLAVGAFLNSTTPYHLDYSWWKGMEGNVSNPNGTGYWPARQQLATMAAQGDPQALAMAAKYNIKPLTPMSDAQGQAFVSSGVLGQAGGLGRGTRNAMRG